MDPWHLPWSFEPWVVAPLLACAALYAVGIVTLHRHAGPRRGVGSLRVTAFATGWLVLAIALISPLDGLGEQLFSAHMVQHELMMVVAAPLFVVGRPLAVWAWALPLQWRRATGRLFRSRAWRIPWCFITGASAAWTLHTLALWLWHLPVLFDAALGNEAWHATQHIAFFGTALLYWWSVAGAVTPRAKAGALLSLFTTFIHTGALGALLTLAQTPWYSTYDDRALAFGISALEDQQLGGLVMWVPTGLVYLLCGLVLAGSLLRPARALPSAQAAAPRDRAGMEVGRRDSNQLPAPKRRRSALRIAGPMERP
jgi:putative membrane protein